MNADTVFNTWYSDRAHGHLPWMAPKAELYEAFCAGVASVDIANVDIGHVVYASDVSPADIYAEYPRKVGRGAALKAIGKAMMGTPGPVLLAATKEYAAAVRQWQPTARYTAAGVDTVPHPSTWYSQERWTDDRSEWKKEQPSTSRFGTTH